MAPTTIKEVVRILVERLPEDATWEDLRFEVSYRKAVEAGLMDLPPTEPLPPDIRETLDRLSHTAGLTRDDILREALELFAHELEGRQAVERITPSTAELKAILARNPRPSSWHDPDEPLF
jgi:hypothetical protein